MCSAVTCRLGSSSGVFWTSRPRLTGSSENPSLPESGSPQKGKTSPDPYRGPGVSPSPSQSSGTFILCPGRCFKHPGSRFTSTFKGTSFSSFFFCVFKKGKETLEKGRQYYKKQTINYRVRDLCSMKVPLTSGVSTPVWTGAGRTDVGPGTTSIAHRLQRPTPSSVDLWAGPLRRL